MQNYISAVKHMHPSAAYEDAVQECDSNEMF